MSNQTAPTTPNFHFFASSVAQWITTTDKRDLREVLAFMDKGDFEYNLFLVPVPHSTVYDINWFQPQVEGVQHLGTFAVKKKRSSARK